MADTYRFVGAENDALFKTAEDVQQLLAGKASAAYSVRDNIKFVGDDMIAALLGSTAPLDSGTAPDDNMDDEEVPVPAQEQRRVIRHGYSDYTPVQAMPLQGQAVNAKLPMPGALEQLAADNAQEYTYKNIDSADAMRYEHMAPPTDDAKIDAQEISSSDQIYDTLQVRHDVLVDYSAGITGMKATEASNNISMEAKATDASPVGNAADIDGETQAQAAQPQVTLPPAQAAAPARTAGAAVRRSRQATRLSRLPQYALESSTDTLGNDYDGAAAKYAGLQPNAAVFTTKATTAVQVGRAAWHIGTEVRHTAADLKDGVIDAKQALDAGKLMIGKEGKFAVGSIAKASIKSAAHQAQTFRVDAEDFASDAAENAKDGAVTAGRGALEIARVAKAVIAKPATAFLLLGAAIAALLLLLICVNMSSTTTVVSTRLCADSDEDIQRLVEEINWHRDSAITDEIYDAFAGETDPNGNPYGYDTLTGRYSNNLNHGVTWSYANGISNDTAEIISLAAVYYQQQWPPSDAFTDCEGYPFFDFCHALTAYGLDVIAQESAPYSCLPYGGCVNGYRHEGETVTIQDYVQAGHTCTEGDSTCGFYNDDNDWIWYDGHGADQSTTDWQPDGTHEVTVYLPIVLPDGAGESELEIVPEDAMHIEDVVSTGDCYGNIVLDGVNLYKGVPNDWFYEPGEITASFSVVTGEGDTAVVDTYEVSFDNATAIPWCPGELHDGQYGHYDLNCTIYLTGYDNYQDPETEEPDGEAGGSGNLLPLAESINDGTVTRNVIKRDQFGNDYIGNGTAARYTATVTLPQSAAGFTQWFDATGNDADGYVAWAELLYKMDWEELYGIVDGIKCRTIGSSLSDAELAALLEELGLNGDDARAQVVALALACQGRFTYGQPSSLRGAPGAPIVGANLDCSSFIQYCYWAVGLPFSASWTGAYATAGDLVAISPDAVQPGDLRVVYASGNVQGHVQMWVGGGSWIECTPGYGVGLNLSNAWMTSHACHYFAYVGF